MGQNSSADWVGPTVNEKKTNDDDELVVLENKISTAHNLNETSRSSSNVVTSEFDFMERGEQDNNALQTFPDDLSKSEQHDPTQPKLSVCPWQFYGDDKTLKRRFQTSFYSEYPWIDYSIRDVHAFLFLLSLLEERKVYIFFLLS